MKSLALLLFVGLASHPLFTAAQTQSSNSAAPGSSCISWTASTNTNYAGGAVQSAASTVAACQAACLAISGCIAIDFNPNGGNGLQCFTLNSLSGQKFTGTNSGITHYDLNTTCSGSCTTNWIASPNTNYAGGIVQSSANSVTACQNVCLTTAGCVAIDFNPTTAAGSQCFTLNNLNGQKFTGGNSGITHYDLNITCSASQSTGGACTNTWASSANTNYAGGTANGATTVTDCQNACINLASCVAIDFNPAGSAGFQCFTLNNLNGQKFTGSNSGITHYDLTRNCGGTTGPPTCVPAWTSSPNTNYAGGTANSATNVGDCQTACLNNAACVAIDFNPAGGTNSLCFILTSLSGQKFSGGNSGITHYDLNRCAPPSASPYFIVLNKAGGALSIEQNTNRVLRDVTTINNAAVFTATTPCLASTVPGFNNTGNCSSWSIMNTNIFLRNLYGNAIVQSQTTRGAQNFPVRFAEDASFYAFQSSSSPGYFQLQPAVNPTANNYYSVSSSYLAEAPDTGDSTLFFLSPVTISSSPVTTTCPNVWTRINGVKGELSYFGGYIGHTSCRAQCLTFPNCIGVSVTSSVCFFATNAATALTQDPAYTYYELSSVSTRDCSRGCITTFSQQTTNFANYSVNTYWVSNSYACRVQCYYSSSCIGVNWSYNTTTGQVQCLIYQATGLLTGTVSYWAESNSFYACGGCDPDTYITLNSTDSGAVPQTGVAGFRPCFTACVNNRMCTGFDLRSANDDCFLSLTSYPNANVSSSSIHVEITRSRCGNGCRDKWDVYANTNLSGTSANGATTDAACRKACQADTTCVAASWNSMNNTCNLATSSSSRNLEGTSPGWITYFLNRAPYCGTYLSTSTAA